MARKNGTARAIVPDEPVTGVTFTVYLDPALADDARNAVDALSGPPDRMTLRRFVEDALAAHSANLRRLKNRGRPWPQRSGPLRRGRKVKPE